MQVEDQRRQYPLDDLIQTTKRLEEENLELKRMVESLEVRERKLDRVDLLKNELDKLMEATETDKRAFESREETLMRQLADKDDELR